MTRCYGTAVFRECIAADGATRNSRAVPRVCFAEGRRQEESSYALHRQASQRRGDGDRRLMRACTSNCCHLCCAGDGAARRDIGGVPLRARAVRPISSPSAVGRSLVARGRKPRLETLHRRALGLFRRLRLVLASDDTEAAWGWVTYHYG